MKDIRIVFMGTPDFSVPVFKALAETYNVVAVVTQPDKKTGRKQILTPSPIKLASAEFNIPLLQPVNIKEEYKKVLEYKPDMIITCAYGQIIPKQLLDYPKYKCINVHASLLPKLRGGAPIHHAIMEGYDKTGITIMYMDTKMDSGDIISQKETKITKKDTLGTLHDRLSEMGKDLLMETLPNIISGNINPIKQDESKVTYGYNITKEEVPSRPAVTDPSPDEGEDEEQDPTTPSNPGETSGNMSIYGTVQPITMIDVTVPLTIQFTIESDRTFTGPDSIEIKSNCPSPLDVNLYGVNKDGSAPSLVAPDTHSDDEWNNLSRAETLASIALMLDNTSLSSTGSTLGRIDSAFQGEKALDLDLSAKYGKAWDNSEDLVFTYNVVFEFAMP